MTSAARSVVNIPVEVRWSIANMHQLDELTARECSEKLAKCRITVSERSASRFLKLFEETGDVLTESEKNGRATRSNLLLDDRVVKYLLYMLSNSADLYLDEMRDYIWESFDIVVSLKTICCTLKKNNITRKKVSSSFNII